MNNKRNVKQRSLTSFFQPPPKKPATVSTSVVLPAPEQQLEEESSFQPSESLTINSNNNNNDNNKENEPIEESFPPNKGRHRRKLTKSKNIIHQLHQQSTYGRRMNDRMIPWTAPSWLPLPTGKVMDLAFDATGVLLAVATAMPQGRSAIRVYDWDMLEAADLQYRRRCVGETAILSSVIDLVLSHSLIAFLQWNPFQPDVLAVGIRYVVNSRLSRIRRCHFSTPILVIQERFDCTIWVLWRNGTIVGVLFLLSNSKPI
jgi:hypothetical protein